VRPRSSLLAVAVAVAGCHHGGDSASVGTSCTESGTCGQGLFCLAGQCATEAPRADACTPPGASQLVTGAAMQGSDPGTTCATSIRAPASGIQVTSLGQHRVGEQLSFSLQPGTWSFTVVSQQVPGTAVGAVTYLGTALPNSVVPTEVRAPDGSVFFDDLADIPTDASGYSDYTGLLGYYGGFTPISGALTLPNTAAGLEAVRSRGGLADGTWKLTVGDFAAECAAIAADDLANNQPVRCTGGDTNGEYDLLVITRPGPISSTGTLDLEVYLANSAVTASSAPDNPHVRRVFTTLSTVLANAGLCLGKVTFHDLPPWAVDRYKILNVDHTGPCDPLSQLFTLGQADSAGVHLFLLDELTESGASGNFQIVGIDGSIPGPSGVPGTINGGAVVPLLDFGVGSCGSGDAVDVSQCGDDRIAYVVAHETGHWLGLYHTSERTGSLFDPLDDTPRCSCSVCAPMVDRPACAENNPDGEPTSMVGSWCAQDAEDCGGAQNLMFWLFDDVRTRAALTREQGEVMRLNPAVR
jgi:hypothetical protein